ncbi:DotG/IcmE/VirB10 family protein [Methylobacterium tarhaniae]|uniref:DotG/IcmE/VirB10 family protein n=1 Tax=Methylobacterium tarhaniae TaxID=1187852 RepID=UPI00069D61DB|nr:DotG/IcmE/VirB10 family protein [Methylobacterium tarhaniae]
MGQGVYGQGAYGQGGGPGGYGQPGYGQGGYGQAGYPGQGGGFGMPGPGGSGGAPSRPGERLYAVARAGDTVYASLDQGFNSDDPQAPIFATIYDVDGTGRSGPLHGVRLIGQIVYSSNQAAIQFTQLVLVDGRQYPLKAYAISPRDARTGISRDVDDHAFERYAGLFAAALVQGTGQVGQLLLQTNRNVAVDPVTGFALSTPGGGMRTQAALGALLPLGQTMTAVGAQNFNKPATIAGAPGLPIGVVFLEPPALPRDAVYVGAPSRRTGVPLSRLN